MKARKRLLSRTLCLAITTALIIGLIPVTTVAAAGTSLKLGQMYTGTVTEEVKTNVDYFPVRLYADGINAYTGEYYNEYELTVDKTGFYIVDNFTCGDNSTPVSGKSNIIILDYENISMPMYRHYDEDTGECDYYYHLYAGETYRCFIKPYSSDELPWKYNFSIKFHGTVISGDYYGSGYNNGVTESTSISWSLSSDGLLKIEGNGSMSYDSYTITSGMPLPEADYDVSSMIDIISKVEIGEGITKISGFNNFYKLVSVSIPSTATAIDGFYKCNSLEEVIIPPNVTYIGIYAFADCSSLQEIIIPSSVQEIGQCAFATDKSYLSSSLESITFLGDAPDFKNYLDYPDGDVFLEQTITVYYPKGNSTWTSDVMKDYGGDITWVAADLEEVQMGNFNSKITTKCLLNKTTNELTVNSNLESGNKVIAASYDKNGRCLSAGVVDTSGGSVNVDADAYKVKLILVNSSYIPQCEAVEIGGV